MGTFGLADQCWVHKYKNVGVSPITGNMLCHWVRHLTIITLLDPGVQVGTSCVGKVTGLWKRCFEPHTTKKIVWAICFERRWAPDLCSQVESLLLWWPSSAVCMLCGLKIIRFIMNIKISHIWCIVELKKGKIHTFWLFCDFTMYQICNSCDKTWILTLLGQYAGMLQHTRLKTLCPVTALLLAVTIIECCFRGNYYHNWLSTCTSVADLMNQTWFCKPKLYLAIIQTLCIHFTHAAANLNWQYSKYVKVVHMHYFCAIAYHVTLNMCRHCAGSIHLLRGYLYFVGNIWWCFKLSKISYLSHLLNVQK